MIWCVKPSNGTTAATALARFIEVSALMCFDAIISGYRSCLTNLCCVLATDVVRYESAEMYWRLYDAGVPVKHLVYNKVGHGDFVVKWPTDYSHQQSTMQSNMQSVIQSGTAECGNGMQPSSQSGTNDSMAGKGRSTTSNDSYNDSYNGQHKSTESSGKTAVCSTQHPAAAAALMSALPPYNADLAAMVSGRVAVRFIRKRQVEQAAAQQQRPSEQASPAAIESQVLAR